MKQTVHAACPHDCPDACGVLITIDNGRATRIQGDPAHPVTRGFLCAKVAKYLDRVYSPDRVLYPMRRVAPKGSTAPAGTPPSAVRRSGAPHEFQRISWDEALDEIASRFKQISAEFGSEAILPYSYGGTLGVLNGASMDRRFFHRLGASQLDRTICSAAGEAGLKSVLGVKLGTEPEQFVHSRYIIAWASNIHGNNVHLWPFIVEARRQGAKLVVIDPYRTRTAAVADWYLPINPGTDAALALSLMHVIINENLHDADYVERYTVGFEQLREKVQEYPPERVAKWTGISAARHQKAGAGIRHRSAVRDSSERRSAALRRRWHGDAGDYHAALHHRLVEGGGRRLAVRHQRGIRARRSTRRLARTDLMTTTLGRPARVVNMVELGKALNTLADPPVKALLVYNSNPAAVCPDLNEVTRGLRRPDLFTVVHEQFFTDTTDYADIVLPATTFFEHKDLQGAYGHYFLQMSDQAIAPLGECRSNVELFRALAQRMGFDEDCFRESVDEMIDVALNSKNPWLRGHRPRAFGNRRAHPVEFSCRPSKQSLSFRSPRETSELPAGKAELYSEALKAQGLDPVVQFTPPAESRHGEQAKTFPLELLARKVRQFPQFHVFQSACDAGDGRTRACWR